MARTVIDMAEEAVRDALEDLGVPDETIPSYVIAERAVGNLAEEDLLAHEVDAPGAGRILLIDRLVRVGLDVSPEWKDDFFRAVLHVVTRHSAGMSLPQVVHEYGEGLAHELNRVGARIGELSEGDLEL